MVLQFCHYCDYLNNTFLPRGCKVGLPVGCWPRPGDGCMSGQNVDSKALLLQLGSTAV